MCTCVQTLRSPPPPPHYLQLNNVTSQREIDELLDEDRYLAIVNACGWPPTKLLTPKNKAEFLNGLIYQEVVTKREPAIAAFGKGLELLGVLTLLRQHQQVMRGALVYYPNKLSAQEFCNLVKSRPPLGRQKLQIYRWFLDYVHDRDTDGMLQIC